MQKEVKRGGKKKEAKNRPGSNGGKLFSLDQLNKSQGVEQEAGKLFKMSSLR